VAHALRAHAAAEFIYLHDGHGFGKRERTKDLLHVTIVVVVEENAAEAAGLSAVFDVKVLIAPLLKLGEVLGVVLVASVLFTIR
jgi:non-canonical (house-cleaning) NTP pyrophosphatase